MSPRVSLSKHTDQITHEADTPVGMRIPLSHATVQALQRLLRHAYGRDGWCLVRRTTVVIDLLGHQVPVAVRSERWGLSAACISGGQKACLRRGIDSWGSGHGGGRRPQLPPQPPPRWGELIDAGPRVVGCATAWWPGGLSRGLRWREGGGLYNRQSVWTLQHNVGFAFHKARGVSDQLDPARRQAWLQDAWPTMLRAAKRRRGLRLVEEEASVAQWGSLSDPWARRGRQPEVPTSGKRKG